MEIELDIIEVDGTFITTDNVKVYTIYFENVPEDEGKIEDLEKYFLKYGNILNIQVEKHYKTFNDEIKISGHVQYEKPESAFKALTQQNREQYVILPADSWKQPLRSNEKLETIKENELSCSLHNLNDDCLIYIFSFLTLSDIINLTLIFPSLKSCLKRCFKYDKTIKLNYDEVQQFTLMQIRQFLCENGKFIKNIEILNWHYNNKSIRLLNFVLHFCKDITSLHISSISFKNNEYSLRISKEFLKLKILKLIDCRLDDQDVLSLSKLNSIRVLNLSGSNNSFTGTYLSNFKQLKELHLEFCEDLLPENFNKIDLTELVLLNITGCNLNNESFRIIKDFALNLKILKISLDKQSCNENHFENFVPEIDLSELIIKNTSRTGCTGYYIAIPDLSNRIKKLAESNLLQKNLKILHLPNFLLNDDCLKYISKFVNLNELLLGFSHDDGIPENFWNLIESLKLLESLGLKIDGFKSFETDFVISLVKRLNDRRFGKIVTLKVEISKRKYNKILQNPSIKSISKIKVVPFFLYEPYSHHALSEN